MGLFDDLFKKKGIPEKMEFMGKEIEINPDAMVFSQQGLDKYEAQDYAGSVRDFTKAINAQPSNQNFYTMRACVFEDMGDDISCENDCRKALELEPKNFVAAYRLGMVFFRKKDFENAIKWLRQSYSNSPDVDMEGLGFSKSNIVFVSTKVIAGNLGNFLTQVKQFEEGIKFLDIAIQLDPNYVNPYIAKGAALAQIGKAQEGIKVLERAVQLGSPQAGMLIQAIKQM
jgi:tetratricopeptide (TPR) repeat protein